MIALAYPCTCGALFDLKCPVAEHRHKAELERIDNPWIERSLEPDYDFMIRYRGCSRVGWRIILPAA